VVDRVHHLGHDVHVVGLEGQGVQSDRHRTGVVMSSILHRDQARVYVKAVREGESDLALSPEEQEAIENAMAGVQPELSAARKAAAVAESPAPAAQRS